MYVRSYIQLGAVITDGTAGKKIVRYNGLSVITDPDETGRAVRPASGVRTVRPVRVRIRPV
jgi:hypothetical protein